MNEIKATPGKFKLSVEIKRKDTGKTETVALVGKLPEPMQKEKEKDNGRHS